MRVGRPPRKWALCDWRRPGEEAAQNQLPGGEGTNVDRRGVIEDEGRPKATDSEGEERESGRASPARLQRRLRAAWAAAGGERRVGGGAERDPSAQIGEGGSSLSGNQA